MQIKFNFPELYLFRVLSKNPNIQNKYKNIYIKIGDTHRGVDVRLNEWQKYLRIFNNDKTLTISEIGRFYLVKDISKEISETNPALRDYIIHKELIKKFNYIRLNKNIYGSDEFFEVVNYISEDYLKNTIKNIIDNIFDNIDAYNIHCNNVIYVDQIEAYERKESFVPRFYQKEMIEMGFKILYEKNYDKFLSWCSPRTGKTYSCCWLVNKLATVYDHSLFNLVITGMPSVKDEWRKTIQEHKDFKDIIFAHRINGNTYIYWNTEESNKQKIINNIEDLYILGKNLNKHIMLFLSLQDIAGKEISDETDLEKTDIDVNINDVKERYKIFFEKKLIDFVIVDEAHYAALNPENKTGKFLDEINKVQHYKRIDNSATPYKAAFNGIYEVNINAYYFNIDEFLIKSEDELNSKEQIEYQANLKDEFPNLFTICPLNYNFFEKNIKILENKKSKIEKKYKAAYNIIQKIFTDFNSGLDLLHNKTIIDNFLCKHIIMSTSEINHAMIIISVLSNYLNNSKIKDYKICQVVGERIISNNIEYFDDVNKYKEYLKEQYKNGIKTITVTCQRWLTGNTFPELDTFIMLRTISSAESYDQWTKRIFNPFHTEYGSKQNVLIWNWNKNMLFNLAAYKAGLLKEGTNISNNNYKDVNNNVINELLKLNIIIPNKNIRKSGEYIYVHDRSVKELIDFLPDEVKNILSLTKIKNIETFEALNTIAEFLSKKINIKTNNGNFEITKYKEGEKTNNLDNSNENHNNGSNKTNSNNTTNNNSETIISLNNHKYFIIDFLRLIKLFTYKRYNIDIKNCDEFINVWNTQLINNKAVMEAFYYGNDIISILKKMKNDEPINYNILNDNIKNFKYDESYFDKFFDKYLNY